MALSLKPRDMAVGGGLLDDVDVVFTNCRFQFFNYGGKGVPAAAFVADLEIADGSTHEQVWTCGEKVAPSLDGKTPLNPTEHAGIAAPYLVALGDKPLSVSSNFGMLMSSAIANGLPEDRISEKAQDLDGLTGHVVRKERPKVRKTEIKNPFDTGGGSPERPPEVLVFSARLKALPLVMRDGTTPAPTPTVGTQPPAPESPAPAGDLTTTTIGHILTLLNADKFKDGLPKASLATEMFALVKNSGKDAGDILRLSISDDFLKAGPWKYENGILRRG